MGKKNKYIKNIKKKSTDSSQVIKTTETKRVARNIYYYYSDGSKIIDTEGQHAVASQWAEFTRDVSTDEKSGRKTYGSWTPVTFPEIAVMDVKGFTPDTSLIPELKDVSPDNPPENMNVFFTRTSDIEISKSFIDVNKTMSFYPAVMWAAETGVATGSKGLFNPEAKATIEQIICFIWRALGRPEPLSEENPFKDKVEPARYSYKAVIWCGENGLINIRDKVFRLTDACKRKNITEMLWRLEGKPITEKTAYHFKDVDEASDLGKAAHWAYDNKVITGKSENFFPDEPCKRGEAVDILYHYHLFKKQLKNS